MRILTIVNVVELLFNTFDAKAILAFRAFINRFPNIKKWSIASDYSEQYKCFSFTIFPYIELPEDTFKYIETRFSEDIKKTKIISSEASDFFHGQDRFFISIYIPERTNLFIPDLNHSSLSLARECILADYNKAQQVGGTDEALEKLRKLYQKSRSNHFKLTLFNNMILLSAFYTFISLLIARERESEVIGWFSDRDDMLSYCDGVVWVLAKQCFDSLHPCLSANFAPRIVVGGHTESVGNLWFDPLIRPADYMAAAIASMNILPDGVVVRNNSKQYQLLLSAICNNDNIVILQANFKNHEPTVGQLIITSTKSAEVY